MTKEDPLLKIRSQIDLVDVKILKSLAERRALIGRIIRRKKQARLPVRDIQRERAILARMILMGKKYSLDARLIARIYREIMADSVRTQRLAIRNKS